MPALYFIITKKKFCTDKCPAGQMATFHTHLQPDAQKNNDAQRQWETDSTEEAFEMILSQHRSNPRTYSTCRGQS